jgi:sigma-B regulation protein RsbU (phosphoserine phosphatase)
MDVYSQSYLQDQLQIRRRQLGAALETQHRQELHALLHEVDSALQRLADGTLGQCAVCHGDIETERLLTDPLTHVCLECLSADEARALEHDLETAASIQTALLPSAESIRPGWEIRYRYEPLGAVSGDHLDLIEPAEVDGPLLFLFGDVAGKGVAASLLMAHLHALFRSIANQDLSLRDLLIRGNRLFCESTMSNSYATLVAGKLWSEGRLEIANLGHPPPCLVRADGVEQLAPSGVPFGLFCQASVETRSFDLEAGDLLFLYTDGLSEATNPQEEEYGQGRIAALLQGLHSHTTSEVLDAAITDHGKFRAGRPKRDDLTLMAIRRDAAV